MEIVVPWTEQSLKDAERLNLKWHHWPGILSRGFDGTLLYICFVLGCIVTIWNSFRESEVNIRSLLIGITGLLALSAITVWHRSRERRKRRQMLSGTRTFRSTNEGFYVSNTRSATGFVPWSKYSGLRTTRRLLVLQRTRPAGLLAKPIEVLTPLQAETLRSLLLIRLPEMT